MYGLGCEIDWQHLEKNTLVSLKRVCMTHNILPVGGSRKKDYVAALKRFRDSAPEPTSPVARKTRRRISSPVPTGKRRGGCLTPQPQRIASPPLFEPKVTSITPILKKSGDPPNLSRSPKFRWRDVRKGRPIRPQKPIWPLYALLATIFVSLSIAIFLQLL